jgi:hypothetical protein
MAVRVAGILEPSNGKSPVVHAKDVQINDEDKRLSVMLDEIGDEASLKVYPIVESTNSVIAPDQYRVFGTVDALSVILDVVDDGYAHEYCFEFTTGENFAGMSIIPEPKWVNEPLIEINKTYQVSILRGIGVIVGA